MQLEVTLTAVVNISITKWTLFGRWSLTNEARVHRIIMFNVVAIHDCTCGTKFFSEFCYTFTLTFSPGLNSSHSESRAHSLVSTFMLILTCRRRVSS